MYDPPEDFYRPPARRRRRGRDPEELGENLHDLQDEIDQVREKLAGLRKSGEAES